MTLHWPHLFFALYYLTSSTQAACPSGCICANTVIECKCSTEDSMTLGPFRNIDFVSKLYIYNCRELTVPADTFSGLAISHELSISSVNILNIASFAFRGLIKYPQRFTIAGCNIPLLPSNTFVGFHGVAHMWFRNVTVSRIAGGAFRHVSDIDYVYFRESNLGRLESHAFSNMTNIAHFFIRGQTSIDRLDQSALQYSTFRKIVLEDIKLRNLSAYVFNGPLRYDSMLFEYVTVEHVDSPHSALKIENISSARKLEFIRCRFERRFPISAFGSNVMEVKLQHTHVGRLAHLPTSTLHNITRLRFLHSSVNTIESKAMYGANHIRSIIFEHCAMGTMGDKAFGAISKVDELTFVKSSIRHFPRSAFDDAKIKQITAAGCHIDYLKSGSFENSQIERLRFAYCELKSIESYAFMHLFTDYFGFEYTRIKEIKSNAFTGVHTTVFNISNCDLRPRVNETWLTDTSFRRLSLDWNKLSCSCSSKLTIHLMVLRQQKTLLSSNLLSLRDNFCVDEVTNETVMLEDYIPIFCRKSSLESAEDYQETTAGLQCRRSLFVVSCTCEENNSEFYTVIDERTTKTLSILNNATTLLISDCRRLHVSRNAVAPYSLRHFVISNCEKLELEFQFWWQKSDPTLRLIRISHIGQLYMYENSFSSLHAGQTGNAGVEFINCTTDKIGTNLFENARIRDLNFINSRIGIFEALFAKKAQVDEFSVQNCKVGRFSTCAFDDATIEKIKVERSRLHEIQTAFMSEILVKTAFICFAENQLACGCDVSGMDALADANGCDGGSNTCLDSVDSVETIAGDLLIETKVSKSGQRRCYRGGISSGAYDLRQRDAAEQFAHSGATVSSMSMVGQGVAVITTQFLAAVRFVRMP